MHRVIVLVAGCLVVLSACATSTSNTVRMTRTALTEATSSTSTRTLAPFASATTPFTTSSTVAPNTTSVPPEEVGPDYVVTGPEGVFRVVGGVATLVVDRPGIWWAADDGMGGVVCGPAASPPSAIEWIPSGSTAPEVIVENAIGIFGYVTLLEGRPHVVTVREYPPETSRSLPSVATVMYDLVSATEKVVGSYPDAGDFSMRPASMGGRRGVDAEWGVEPPGSSLVFSDLSGIEIEMVTNPWPEFCLGCGLWPYLSPDGNTLAIVEFLPGPADLGVTDWDSFIGLDKTEQWDRWVAARAIAPVTLRIVDLTTGETLQAHPLPPMWSIGDFDGRYAVLCASDCDLPSDHLLIDRYTGEQLPINWGVSEPGAERRTIRLFLPLPAANETTLRADGLGMATFGEPMGPNSTQR